MMRGRLPAIGCKDGREGERTLERLRRGNKRMNEGRKAIAMDGGRDPIDGQHKANLYFGGGGKNNCSSAVHTLTARMPDGSGSNPFRSVLHSA